MSILGALWKRERDGRPIGTAVIGAGQLGSALADPIARCAGFRPAAVCDVFADRAAASGAVPIGLTQGAQLLRGAPWGAAVTAADVALDESLTIVRLGRRQDTLAVGAEQAS